jgi:hypothetical protein
MTVHTKLDAQIVRREWEIESSPPVEGAVALNALHAFLGRFVAYPSEHALVAHVLWIAHTHLMDAWESTPRLAFLSPEPESGKTRSLEVTELLVPNPVVALNVTPAYIFRKVGDQENGPPTLLHDEIDTVFGPKAKDNEEIRGLYNAGHRHITGKTSTTLGSVISPLLPRRSAMSAMKAMTPRKWRIFTQQASRSSRMACAMPVPSAMKIPQGNQATSRTSRSSRMCGVTRKKGRKRFP